MNPTQGFYWLLGSKGRWEIVYIYEGTYRRKTGIFVKGWSGWTQAWSTLTDPVIKPIEKPE